jgi:hypothetical protein
MMEWPIWPTYTRNAVYSCDLETQGIFHWSQQVGILFWLKCSHVESHEQPADTVKGASIMGTVATPPSFSCFECVLHLGLRACFTIVILYESLLEMLDLSIEAF